MATWREYRTARTHKRCDECRYTYPGCLGVINPGERYCREVATPNDDEVNQSDHWQVLNICHAHMWPEPRPND